MADHLEYVRAPLTRVMFGKIVTPKFMRNVKALHTYNVDIGSILDDAALYGPITAGEFWDQLCKRIDERTR